MTDTPRETPLIWSHRAQQSCDCDPCKDAKALGRANGALIAECDTLRAQLAAEREKHDEEAYDDMKAAKEQAEAQLAAREGEIATLKEENDELTRRVTMAEPQPRSAASTNETAPCDCTRHRHCPRCHGAGCISDGPNYSHCIECGHEWRHDQPETSDARPTDSATGTATGSATKCLSCAALTERLNQLVTSLGMVYHCDPTGDGTAPGWRNHRAEKAEARADTAEAQLRAQADEITRLTVERNQQAAEADRYCSQYVDHAKAIIQLRAGLERATAMCRAATTWNADDLQGLRFHAQEAAREGMAALAAPPIAKESQP